MHETVITRHGLSRLTEELERLTSEGRSRMALRLAEAAARGANRLEDADYLDAVEDQALLERRIAILEDRVLTAEVVEPRLGNGRVDVGERIRVHDLVSDDRLELELVGPHEADVSAGRISVASPLGRAVVGARAGAVVEVDAPAGTRRFRVLAVEAPAPAYQPVC